MLIILNKCNTYIYFILFSEYQKATARYHKERRMEMNTQRAVQEVNTQKKYQHYEQLVLSFKAIKY